MRKTFHDDELERRFQADGYVIVPLLDQSAIERLDGEYRLTRSAAKQHGFHATINTADASYRRRVHDATREVMESPILAYLDGFRFVSGNYVVKETGESSAVPMHQDWAFVDERHHASVGVWSPLVDVDEQNGNLWVLRESHRHVLAWRGEAAPGLPHYLPIFEEALTPPVRERYQESLRLTAGEAVFYDHRTVHFSPPNRSNDMRIAVNIGLIPAEAQLLHHYRTSEHNIDLLAIDDDFFTDFVIGDTPVGDKVGELDYRFEVRYPDP